MHHEVSVAAAKARFAECVRQAENGEAVVITRHGKVVAAIVSAEDLAELHRSRAGSERGTLLGLVGVEGGDDFADLIDDIVASRGPGRPVPDFE